MQSCAPTQSAFSYPLSFRRLCQHSFPLPLPVATVNSFVLSCYGTTNISHPVPAGHTYPLRCFAPQWARFDNRHSTSAPTPTLTASAAAAQEVQAVPLNRQCYPPHFMRECIPPNLHDPQRAKGSLDRRSKWFSLVPFFLQKKKGTRAGARNAPACARRRRPPYPGGISRHQPKPPSGRLWRDLIIAQPQGVVSKGGGRSPLLCRFKGLGFLRKGGNSKSPFP